MKTLLRAAFLVFGGGLAAWKVFVRLQGDSEVSFGSGELSDVSEHDGVLHGEVVLVNRGRQLAAIRRVEGRVLQGPPAKVRVTRQGSRSPERGLWISNLLKPGESCVAEIDLELEARPTSPIILELDVHEIGRRPLVHRRASFSVPPPETASAAS